MDSVVMGVLQYMLATEKDAKTLVKPSSEYASKDTASQFLQAAAAHSARLLLIFWEKIHLQPTTVLQMSSQFALCLPGW